MIIIIQNRFCACGLLNGVSMTQNRKSSSTIQHNLFVCECIQWENNMVASA